MKITHKDLCAFYQSYISGRLPPSRNNCPSMPDLIEFFKPKSSRKLKTRIIDHITQCAPCAREFDLILTIKRRAGEMDQEIMRLLGGDNEPQESSVRRMNKMAFFHPIWKYAALAIGIVSLSLSVLTLLDKNRDFFIKGQNGRGELEIDARLVEPVNDKFEKSHLVFIWKVHKGADSYALDLFDESLRLIWKSPNLRETQYHLPPDIIQKLEPFRTYFWMITVAMQNGTIIESPLAHFFLVQ